MKSEDTRNLFLAIALSVLVMAAWQYFYAGPLYQREHQAQTQANTPAPASGAAPSEAPGAPGASIPGTASPPGGPAPSVAGTVAEVLAASPRVAIDTPSIRGSIDVQGGKFDDIILKDYRETIDPKSQNIRLFSPPGAPDAYWAETGFVSTDASKTPNLDTVWTADRQTLTVEQPVTLTWDNGAGLTFKRVISVDDKYMFTIADSVVNSGAAPATVQPFGLILRHGRPNVAGYSVLHEGFVGVIAGGDAAHNRDIAESVLSGAAGPQRDIVLANAALALIAADKASNYFEAMNQAAESIDSGAARGKLVRLRLFVSGK